MVVVDTMHIGGGTAGMEIWPDYLVMLLTNQTALGLFSVAIS
jgi:hypothetical protein